MVIDEVAAVALVAGREVLVVPFRPIHGGAEGDLEVPSASRSVMGGQALGQGPGSICIECHRTWCCGHVEFRTSGQVEQAQCMWIHAIACLSVLEGGRVARCTEGQNLVGRGIVPHVGFRVGQRHIRITVVLEGHSARIRNGHRALYILAARAHRFTIGDVAGVGELRGNLVEDRDGLFERRSVRVAARVRRDQGEGPDETVVAFRQVIIGDAAVQGRTVDMGQCGRSIRITGVGDGEFHGAERVRTEVHIAIGGLQ